MEINGSMGDRRTQVEIKVRRGRMREEEDDADERKGMEMKV